MVVKANPKALSAGMSSLEAELLANVALSDNNTARERMVPQIHQAHGTGEMQPCCLSVGAPAKPQSTERMRVSAY